MTSILSEETRLRDEIAEVGKSLFDRCFTFGSTGNISARLSNGEMLMTPTNASMGALDPGRLSKFTAEGVHVGGDKPTKEMPLHAAFYDTRQCGAVVHLHCCHAVALSTLPDQDVASLLREEVAEPNARFVLDGEPQPPILRRSSLVKGTRISPGSRLGGRLGAFWGRSGSASGMRRGPGIPSFSSRFLISLIRVGRCCCSPSP